ncbi:MAG: NUDIX domain-containing protein [Trebonia sp.]
MIVPEPSAMPIRQTRSRLLGRGRYEYREYGFTLNSAGRGDRHLVRHVVHRGDSAYVLPVDRPGQRVGLCRQFRAGKFLAGSPDGYTLEAPGGLVEPGADPAETARRECLEELGVVVTCLEHVATLMPHPTLMPERAHLFIGECLLGEHDGGPRGVGSDEETELAVMPLDLLRSATTDQPVDDMRTFLLLVLLENADLRRHHG